MEDLAMHTVPVGTVNPEDQPAPEVWLPAISIREDADKLYVEAELPGMEPADVAIVFKDGVLTISGVRANPFEEDDFLFLDRKFGPFTRSCVLPLAVEAEEMERSSQQGVLCLILPKRGHGHHNRSASGVQDYWVG